MAARLNDEEMKQRDIAKSLPITEVTLRNRQKEFANALKIKLKR
jgi:transcription initiation factor TFIIIB Brf1 subunit/transcription initiation factor TFIIB